MIHRGQKKPPAERRGLPRSEMRAKQGKPVGPPETAGGPQGKLMALRVKECGESEGQPVIGWIRAATPGAKASRLPRGLSW